MRLLLNASITADQIVEEFIGINEGKNKEIDRFLVVEKWEFHCEYAIIKISSLNTVK